MKIKTLLISLSTLFVLFFYGNCAKSLDPNEYSGSSSSLGFSSVTTTTCQAQSYFINEDAAAGLFSSRPQYNSDGSCTVRFPRSSRTIQGQAYDYYIWGDYTVANSVASWNADQYCKEKFGPNTLAENIKLYENASFEETYFLMYNPSGQVIDFRSGSKDAALYFVISEVTCR